MAVLAAVTRPRAAARTNALARAGRQRENAGMPACDQANRSKRFGSAERRVLAIANAQRFRALS